MEGSSLVVKSISNEDENIDEFIEQDEKLPDKVLNHSKWNFSIMQKKTFESDYLKSRKWKYIYEDEEPYIEINYENIKKNLKNEDIKLLFDNINKSNLTDALNNCEIDDDIYPIGVLHSLEYLIEKRKKPSIRDLKKPNRAFFRNWHEPLLVSRRSMTRCLTTLKRCLSRAMWVLTPP